MGMKHTEGCEVRQTGGYTSDGTEWQSLELVELSRHVSASGMEKKTAKKSVSKKSEMRRAWQSTIQRTVRVLAPFMPGVGG